MPRYALIAAWLAPVVNARNRLPGLAALLEGPTGISAKRKLPDWRLRPFALAESAGRETGPEVALLADTFNTYFEPENLRDAVDVLVRLGYRVSVPRLPRGRPVCCGRTFLSAGLVEEARAEARRLLEAVRPYVERGVPIVGLEPSCLLTLRDEILAMGLGESANKLAGQALLFEEFLAREADAGRIKRPIAHFDSKVLLHGHCHQKSFGAMDAVGKVLALVDGLKVETVEAGCCGMAGAFGYGVETYDLSMKVGETALLPAVRRAAPQDLIAADGFSCRHQIRDGAGREASHVARVLRRALALGGGA